jgi:Aspartyl/Asparaginyl beta-hydroxylase
MERTMATDSALSWGFSNPRLLRFVKRWPKRVALFAVAVYFAPKILAVYFVFGLIDFLRNTQRTADMFERYFAGNGVQVWFLSPFNLLMDALTLPYRNKGIYALSDLPQDYQDEITHMIEAANKSNLVGKLQAQMSDKPKGMIFFKWYGKNIKTSVDVPEFHHDYKYIRTIGVSIFNKKQSACKHFGTFRVTLRVLYNINHINSKQVYIKVGKHVHYWRENKLFIFDDTLQHASCNESDDVRYCMFVLGHAQLIDEAPRSGHSRIRRSRRR